MAALPTVTLTAHCLCKANVFTAEVPKSKLPLPASACHCDSCRHVTGAMYSIDSRWPVATKEVDTSNLRSYKFSERIAVLFCGTCSTPMFFGHLNDPDAELGVFTGTLKNDNEDVIKILHHIFVGDTIDGGATMWLRKPNVDGTEAKRYKIRNEGDDKQELPYDWPPSSSLTGYEGRKEDTLPIRCRCKGVDLLLHRGDYRDKKEEELPWIVDPKTRKILGGCCSCDSCRLSSGVDVFNWAFAELKDISFSKDITAQGKVFPTDSKDLRALIDAQDPSTGTLKYYSSSPGVQRFFCSSCSACIFYAADDRSWMVDIAIGALEASDGARAEGFLSWKLGKVSYAEDTKGGWREHLLNQVEKEAEQWRQERGYPKVR